ncbi:MAG: Protein TolB [Verrucomicrobiota bacterium]|jgi:TolB protein
MELFTSLRRPLLQALSALSLLGLGLPSVALAQGGGDIVVKKSAQLEVGLAAFAGPDGNALAQIVQRDLQLSGLLKVVAPNAAKFQVSATSSGSSLRGLLSESGSRPLLERSYPGSARAQAHAFANDILETLIPGAKGIAGSRVAFVATQSGAKEIYLVDIDGSNLIQLTKDRSISVSPCLSQDARRLAYTGYQSGYADVYEVDLASGSRRRIMKYPGTNSGAAYSPDGSRFAVTLSKDGNPELYVTDSSGGSPNRLTRSPGVESSPTWSPDGRELIFSSDTEGGPALYRIAASGGSPRKLSTGHAYNTEPNWSPDGTKVAFNTREGGSFTIAVLHLASGAVTLYGEGTDPVWGPNSRHLVYAAGDNLVLLDTETRKKERVASGLDKISEPSWSR